MPDAGDQRMGRVRHIHFVGIGGAGMSGIAEVLHNLGYRVSGSDAKDSATLARLRRLGIAAHSGHDAQHVNGSDVVVFSSAVTDANPELAAARAQRIPVVPRAEMLAELMRFREGVAIAGTHGKTTTTSLVASLLSEAGLDPTYVIGGRLNSSGSHARLGGGRFLVAEADESDASFLHLQPVIAVVTNIDADHMRTYGGDPARLKEVFVEFLHHLPFWGLAVLCADDAGVRKILPRISRAVVSYGFEPGADFQAHDVHPEGMRTHFAIRHGGQDDWLRVCVNLPGRHNVLNSLAAVAVADALGVGREHIAAGLRAFQGIGRRCEVLGELRIGALRVTLIDDYAHHPTEIAAVLAAVRASWAGRRVVGVFQPHRYTRTHDLFDEFCRVLSQFDGLLLLDIYAAGEEPITGADSAALCRAIAARGTLNPVVSASRAALIEALPGAVRDGDLLLVMGAGDVGQLGGELTARYAA
jgi:UDP-N-acetylmuramate--alanine ligase